MQRWKASYMEYFSWNLTFMIMLLLEMLSCIMNDQLTREGWVQFVTYSRTCLDWNLKGNIVDRGRDTLSWLGPASSCTCAGRSGAACAVEMALTAAWRGVMRNMLEGAVCSGKTVPSYPDRLSLIYSILGEKNNTTLNSFWGSYDHFSKLL